MAMIYCKHACQQAMTWTYCERICTRNKIKYITNLLRRSRSYTNSSDNQVRVRFAPSPTGQIHLGGLRSALYNHLFTKSRGGKFILRIEDTDQTRLVPGATEKLSEMLKWAGIEIDEGPEQGGPFGPYIQSQRQNLYHDSMKPLLDNGSVYHCFCTTRRLDLLRKEALRRRETPKYDNHCRDLIPDEVEEKLANNVPYVLRFKLSSYTEAWNDLVFGPIVYDVASIEADPVLLKSDGLPTYHYANVVDDHMMQITHVLRGVEWLVSTTKHVLLYKAFGWEPPQFAHLPLLLNKDGKKLSKRENDIHVEHFKNAGYFPEALQRFICSVGSGFTVDQSQFPGIDIRNLHKYFDLKKMNTNSSRLDMTRLDEHNRTYISSCLKSEELKKKIVEQVRNIIQHHFADRLAEIEKSSLEDDFIANVLDWCQESDRITVLHDLTKEEFLFLWKDITSSHDIVNDVRTSCKHCTPTELLELALHNTECLDDDHFNINYLKNHFKRVVEDHGVKKSEFMKCIRCALYGQKAGPSIAELATVLRKQQTVKRIKTMLETLEQSTAKLKS